MYSINAAALLIGAAGLLSRALGILRDRLLASHFGASRELDIYYAAFQIPDAMYTIFLLGAASAAIIPVLLDISGKGNDGGRGFMKDLIIVFSWGSAALAVFAFFLMPYLSAFVAPGFSESERSILVTISRVMLLSPILLGLSSVLSSAIQSARLFVVYALTGVVYNAGIIIGILFFLPVFGIQGLAYGVLVGALFHLLIQIAPFYRLGFRFPQIRDYFFVPWRTFFQGAVGNVFSLSLPRTIALSFRQITFIVYIALASTLLSGSISILQLAYNLQYIPVGIFGLSFAIAAFPQLTDYRIEGNGKRWGETISASLRAILFWVAPLSALFYVLRAQIVRVAFGGGRFDWGDTILTAAVFGVFSVAIIAESVIPLLVRSFYSIGDTRRPLLIGAVASFISILSAVLLVTIVNRFPGELVDFFRHILKVGDTKGIAVIGLSWAFVVGGICEAVTLFLVLRKKTKRYFGENTQIPVEWGALFRIGWVALLAGIVTFGTLRTVNLVVTLDTFAGVFTQGTLSFLAGAVTYVGILYLFGTKEIIDLLETARRHLFRRDVLPRQLDGNSVE